ncbi:MAG: hypothetical protein ABSF15_09370 [Candidatus Sulfotelmatobacter sp.]|jgi:hypothetical protein
MVKKVLRLLFVFALAFPMSALFVQSAPAQDQMAKQDRWEGNVVASNPDKSTLAVRKAGSSDQRFVSYDSSTKWVSQAHGSKTVNDIDASQVKEGDRVICKGTWDKDNVLHATLISKRLSH